MFLFIFFILVAQIYINCNSKITNQGIIYMTSRQYILSAIAHKQPEKVPVDFGATPSSGISAIAYSHLKQYAGFTGQPTKVYDVVQQLAEPEEYFLDSFRIDVIDVGRAFTRDPSGWYDITLQNGQSAQYPSWFRPVLKPDKSWYAPGPDGNFIARMPHHATFFDQIYFPYLEGYPTTFKELKRAMAQAMWAAFPTPPWDRSNRENFWPDLKDKCLKIKKETDRALMVGVGGNLFEWGTFLRRMDNFLMDLVLDPAGVEKLLDALMEIHLEKLEKVCHWLGDVVDIVRFGDDLGAQNGPFMDPVIYRKLFKPRQTQLCDYVHKHSNMHTYLHSSLEQIVFFYQLVCSVFYGHWMHQPN